MPLTVHSQQKQWSIDDCFRLARQNYPLIKKQGLLKRTADYSLENASKAYLPQFSLNGQASYQSQTIDFSQHLPAAIATSFPSLSKDQYRIQAEAGQIIYDGGTVKNQKLLSEANEAIQQQSLEVSLHELDERVTQVYFSILLMDQQMEQNGIRKSDLQEALNKATIAYENGAGFKSNMDELKAALINVDMTSTELRAQIQAYRSMLSLLTGVPLGENDILTVPAPPPLSDNIRRPEIALLDLQKKRIDIEDRQLKTEYRPKLNAFLQAAYGRPTLNFIENKFGAWWVGGVRLVWPFGPLYTLKNNQSLLQISRQSLDVDKETFLFNTRLSLSQQNGDIEKYRELLKQDDEVISLLSSVIQSARAQLDNGVITVHEYIGKLNEENMARQARVLHRIQLLKAQYIFKNLSGN